MRRIVALSLLLIACLVLIVLDDVDTHHHLTQLCIAKGGTLISARNFDRVCVKAIPLEEEPIVKENQ